MAALSLKKQDEGKIPDPTATEQILVMVNASRSKRATGSGNKADSSKSTSNQKYPNNRDRNRAGRNSSIKNRGNGSLLG